METVSFGAFLFEADFSLQTAIEHNMTAKA